MAGFPKSTLADKARIPRSNVPLALSRDKIIAGLYKVHGNISRVADSLGCSRHSLRRYIDTDPELLQVLKDTRERIGDLLEDTAVEQALQGNGMMTQFLLKSRHADRGYSFDRENRAEDMVRMALDYISNRSKSPVNDPQT